MAERGRSQGAVPAARPRPAPGGCDGHLELPAPRAGSAGPLHPNCSPAQKRPLWDRGEGQHHTPCQTISWGARVPHPVIQTACGGGRFPRMPLSRVGTRRKTRTPGRGGSASRTGTRDEASAATRAHAPCTPRPAPPARGRCDRDVTQRAPAQAVGSGRTLTTPGLQARAHAPAPRRTQPVTTAKLCAASSSSTRQKVSPSAVRRRKCAWPGGL